MLRWFGDTKRFKGRDALERPVRVDVPGCCQMGRPKKTWRECVRNEQQRGTEEAKRLDVIGRVSSTAKTHVTVGKT